MTDRRIIMIQQGARRNYVYPRQLEENGLLHSLITDAAWSAEKPAWWAKLGNRIARLRGGIARRQVDGVPAQRLRASLLPNAASIALRFMHEERRYAIEDEILAFRNLWGGIGKADVVLNYHGNGGSFLDRAKRSGAAIVTDFIITPKYLEIEQTERDRWSGWEEQTTPQSVIDFYRRRMAWLVGISDLYFCPAESVARDLSDLPGFDPARVRILPYGISGVTLSEPATRPGRVLFAGAAGLRKGLPYLAKAAAILRSSHPHIEIVVAGSAEPAVRRRPEVEALTFLGVLDRKRMAEEFACADVFCLPSLAEGSATSIFEALANGLPVVTTPSSGSIVSDGRDGLVVPERDPEAIAAALVRIVTDRDLRRAMSDAARATIACYTDEYCGRRFVTAINELLASRPRQPG